MCNLFFCDTVSGRAVFDITKPLYLYGLLDRIRLKHTPSSVGHFNYFLYFFLWWEMKSRGRQSQSGKVIKCASDCMAGGWVCEGRALTGAN